MAWPNTGGGAGIWDGADLYLETRDILESLCWAVNERQIYVAAGTVCTITRSSSTATVTATSHGYATGDRIGHFGADQSEYNGINTITVVNANSYTYTVSGSPATPATGTIYRKAATSSFTYDKDFNTKKFPSDSDFANLPVYLPSVAPSLSVASITRSGTTATARIHRHSLFSTNYIVIAGASQSEYNGRQLITGFPTVGSVSSITRSGAVATMTIGSAHGLSTGDWVRVQGTTQTEYNGVFEITVTSSTVFTYAVSGTPATPATGSPVVETWSYIQFEVTGTPATPATGTITATNDRHGIYRATWTAGTARFYSRSHGFSVGQWVEVYSTAYSSYRFWGPVTTVSTDYFEIANSASLTAEIFPSPGNLITATRPAGLRKVMRELQDGIEGLITASTAVNVIRFVEDTAPYDTNYTLVNLLDATTANSPWMDLFMLDARTVGDAFVQMREALDLLVTMTATMGGSLEDGDYGGGSDASYEAAWDDATLGGLDDTIGYPADDSGIGGHISFRFGERGYNVKIIVSRVANYATPLIQGTFVAGYIKLFDSHADTILSIHPGVEQAEYDVSDGTDTYTLTATFGGGVGTTYISKSSSFFSVSAPTLTFTSDTPTSNPLPALGITEKTFRSATLDDDDAGLLTRELVPGTHLTYG